MGQDLEERGQAPRSCWVDAGGTWVRMKGPEGPRIAASIPAFILQANVEHLTDKMKTDIQRGLVLR